MKEPGKLIKQLKLSPPFTKDDVGYIYDSNMVVVAQTRGWGHFRYLRNAEKLQDAFAQFIVDAMNEKLTSRTTCGKEQRLFLDEIEKGKYYKGIASDTKGILLPLLYIPQDSFESDLQKVTQGE